MSSILLLCGGFLLAVLWMDLMFDVQALRHRADSGTLPEVVLGSIAAYYHRVTTQARPMGHLVGAVMAVALVALAIEIVRGGPAGLISLPFCAGPIVLAFARVVPNAVRRDAGKPRSKAGRPRRAVPREIAVGPPGANRDESQGYRHIEKPRRSGAFP